MIVETDHSPLIPIFKKPLNNCPARLQRMLLQIQKYDIEVRYKPGKELYLADALSRAYLKEQCLEELDKEVGLQVCLVFAEINASESKLQQLRIETEKDLEMQLLKEVIIKGWPTSIKKCYYKYKSELTVLNDLIFKGNALVIPYQLRQEMINKAHYNHMGISKCLKLAQEAVFWPTMNNEIKQAISQCQLCLRFARSQSSDYLMSHEIPKIPWNKVGCDLFELNGRKFILVVDYYSKYIEIEELHNNTTSNRIIVT